MQKNKFECDICKQRFETRSHLKAHESKRATPCTEHVREPPKSLQQKPQKNDAQNKGQDKQKKKK
jgi:hypothetical protein